MKAGAVEFLTKPDREQDLLDAINVALETRQASSAGHRRYPTSRCLAERTSGHATAIVDAALQDAEHDRRQEQQRGIIRVSQSVAPPRNDSTGLASAFRGLAGITPAGIPE